MRIPYKKLFGFVSVAGLLTFPFSYIGQTTNTNEALTSGMYRIYGESTNGPGFQFGVLVVFNAAQFIFQLATDVGQNNPSAKYRTRNSSGVWSNWESLG